MNKFFQLIIDCFKLAIGCFTTKYFRFKGRASRKEFISFLLFYALLDALIDILILLDHKVFFFSEGAFTTMSHVYGFFALIPGFTLTMRRLHDFNVSGWTYFFFNFFGTAIIVYLILKADSIGIKLNASTPILVVVVQCLALIFLKGSPSINKYGEPPIN